ncbi:MAG TPA: TlpA disulfide reductase family protein [Chitinophagales bacterium]|nr:TlpA disulfide reductase family protein [Chitinophagales bacterium]
MKKMLLAGLLVLLVGANNAQNQKPGIEKILGEKSLPDVSLLDVNGKKINVADYGKSGKITILSFWATWCIPCKKELTNMSDLYEEWQKKYNVQIVAVSIDDSRSSPKVKPYVDGQRWQYDVLLDVNQDLKRALNIQSVPFTVIVDSKGKIVNTHSGYVEGDEYTIEEELQKMIKQQ